LFRWFYQWFLRGGGKNSSDDSTKNKSSESIAALIGTWWRDTPYDVFILIKEDGTFSVCDFPEFRAEDIVLIGTYTIESSVVYLYGNGKNFIGKGYLDYGPPLALSWEGPEEGIYYKWEQ
jgi:hypothetical protein